MTPSRASYIREINRLRALLKLPAITDDGKQTMAQLAKTITNLTAAVPKTATTSKPATSPTTTKPSNPGAVTPPAKTTTSTKTTTTVKTAAPTKTTTTAKGPTRASLYREINRLRGLLKLAAVTDDGKLTMAQLQREVEKLQYSVDNPKQPTKNSTPTTTPVGGDKTKAQLVREMDKLLASVGMPASGINPDSANRTQLVNSITELQKQVGGGGAGGGGVLTGGGAGTAGDAIMGIPRNTFIMAGVGLLGLTVLVTLKKKGRK